MRNMPIRGYLQTGVHKKGIGDANRGRKHSDKSRENMREAQRKNSVKISESLKRAYNEGRKKRISFKGKNHWNWKGGVSKNPEYSNWQQNKHNRSKRSNGGSHTFAEWEILKAQYNWTCPCCKKTEPEIKLTEDHIVPVSKGGSDNIENIQPLCRSCNGKKYVKIIKY